MPNSYQKEITIVGGGIDALMTAYMLKLRQPELQVKVVAKNGDPRLLTRDATGAYSDQKQYSSRDGSTLGGQISRFITVYEGHNYTKSTEMYPAMDEMFQKILSDGGWLGKPIEQCSNREINWLARRLTACHVENGSVNDELFNHYVDLNKTAMKWWKELRTNDSELFGNAKVVDGVSRIYDSKSLFDAARDLHEADKALDSSHGAVLAADIDPKSVFFDAASRGFVKGGVLNMDSKESFTLNVQRFVENLISKLESEGVTFEFNQEVTDINKNDSGEVTSLTVKKSDGMVFDLKSQNFVMAVGAYSDPKLLDKTPASGKINGVAGGWMTLPAPESMDKSFKVHGDRYFVNDDGKMVKLSDAIKAGQAIPNGSQRAVVDQNHLLSTDTDGSKRVFVGGGYAWVGENPRSLAPEQLKIMQAENQRVARETYGSHYDKCNKEGKVVSFDNVCVRSFTDNDIPLTTSQKTSTGGQLIVIGGGNTGTTTAAPATANLVAQLLGLPESRAFIKMASSVYSTAQQAPMDALKKVSEMNNQWDKFMKGSGQSVYAQNLQSMRI